MSTPEDDPQLEDSSNKEEQPKNPEINVHTTGTEIDVHIPEVNVDIANEYEIDEIRVDISNRITNVLESTEKPTTLEDFFLTSEEQQQEAKVLAQELNNITSEQSSDLARIFQLAIKEGDLQALDQLLTETPRRGVQHPKAAELIRYANKTNDPDLLKDEQSILTYLRLQNHLNQALDTLTPFNLNENDAPLPRVKEVYDFLKELTPQQIEVLAEMEWPTFQFIPNCHMARYKEALKATNTIEGQQDPCFSNWTKSALKRADNQGEGAELTKEITNWKIAITEGAKRPQLPSWDYIRNPNPNIIGPPIAERLQNFRNRCQTTDTSGVDFKRQFLLAIQALREDPPQPIDDSTHSVLINTVTLISEEPTLTDEDGTYIAGGHWASHGKRMYYEPSNITNAAPQARFRPSVQKTLGLPPRPKALPKNSTP